MLRRNQHWRFGQIFFDFIESLLLFCPPAKLIIGFDLHQTNERLNASRQIRDKSSDKVNFTDELLQFFLRSRWFHSLHSFLTLEANLDSPFMHQESQKLTGRYAEGTLLGFILSPNLRVHSRTWRRSSKCPPADLDLT